jgi:hypothetical protein
MSTLRAALVRILIGGALGLALPGVSQAQTCEDSARTIFTGGPGSEGCLLIDDQTTCEMAWVEGHQGPASCAWDEALGGCFGCGPNNEGAGVCTNTCIAPPEPPDDGVPIPCTIGFWKNRADTPMGQSQHFPDPNFDEVVDQAALLTPIFTDGGELLDALGKKGRRTQQEKAEQQLAALQLNLAAGDLFPEDGKCALYEGNELSENSCVGAPTVGDALVGILADMSGGLYEDAKDCADDINNGIGVVGIPFSD